jgi:hypothetical protein
LGHILYELAINFVRGDIDFAACLSDLAAESDVFVLTESLGYGDI